MTDAVGQLTFETGEVTLRVNGSYDLVFNPTDVTFSEKFYRLMHDLGARQEEYKREADAMGGDEVDEFGLPVNMPKAFELIRKVCDDFRAEIDRLFGEGTSQGVFGDTRSIEAIGQFMVAVVPYIQKARSKVVGEYVDNKRVKPKVQPPPLPSKPRRKRK